MIPGRGILLGLLLSSLLAPSSSGIAGEATPAPAAAKEVSDDLYARLSVQDPQGRKIKLGEFKGRVRVFDVWATWCGPCRMIIPHLNRLYERYRDQGLVVIGVSVDDSPADVVAFTARTPIRYPTGMMNRDLFEVLGSPEAVPTSYLVDRSGRLRRTFVGFVEPEVLEREIRKALEAP